MWEQLSDDQFARNVFFSTDGTTDSYKVVDPASQNYTFTIGFPEGTGEWLAYQVINQIAQTGCPSMDYFALSDDNAMKPRSSGRTSDRENCSPIFGKAYFDLDLGYPIWYVGYGVTGWVNSSGVQV